jgi:c(7)-type cytochrome triheme protein
MKRFVSLGFVTFLALALAFSSLALGEDHGGDIHYSAPVVGVLFSHAVHVDDNGLDCESCHDGLFEYEALAAQQQPDFNMKALYEGRYCGACHDGNMAFSSDTRCTLCHEGVKGYERALGHKTSMDSH